MVIDGGGRTRIGALLKGRNTDETYGASGDATHVLEAQGLRAVRMLAERDGLVFVEGVKGSAT